MLETEIGIYYSRLPQVSNVVGIRIKLAEKVPTRSMICMVELFAENDELISEIDGLSFSNKLESYFCYIGNNDVNEFFDIGPVRSKIAFRSVRMRFLPWGNEGVSLSSDIITFVGLEQELFSTSWSPGAIPVGSILLVSREVN